MIGTTNAVGSNVTADMLGIVIKGNSTPVGASVGQYVIVKNSTISGITDGLYTAAQVIPANTAIDSTYLAAVSGGGLNDLSKVEDVTSYLSNINTSVIKNVRMYKSLNVVTIYGETKLLNTIADTTILFNISSPYTPKHGCMTPCLATHGPYLGTIGIGIWGALSVAQFRLPESAGADWGMDCRSLFAITYVI